MCAQRFLFLHIVNPFAHIFPDKRMVQKNLASIRSEWRRKRVQFTLLLKPMKLLHPMKLLNMRLHTISY